MNSRLCLLLLLALAFCTSGRAAVTPAFLDVGKYYKVIASIDTPLPGSDLGRGGINQATVRIIKISSNQWCWVEYDAVQFPPVGQPGPVIITKKRVWFNFAQVALIEEASAPNYAAFHSQGYKVVLAP